MSSQINSLGFNQMSYPYEEESFKFEGNRVVYIDHGSGEPIIFLHGQASDLLNFEPVYPLFQPTNRIIALDYPGFGKSDKPETEFTEKFLVQMLDALYTITGIESATLVGHSYGGYIAMLYGVAKPERVRSLVLISPAGIQKLSPVIQTMLRKSFTVEKIMDTPVEKALKNYRGGSRNWTPEMERYVLRRAGLLKNGGEEYRKYAHAMIQAMELMLNTTIRNQIGAIQIPTLIIWGREDPLVPFRVAGKTQQLIPDARLVTIEACGHFPMLEYPERFYEAIRTFLQDIS